MLVKLTPGHVMSATKFKTNYGGIKFVVQVEECVIIQPTEMFKPLERNPQFTITDSKNLLLSKITNSIGMQEGNSEDACELVKVMSQIRAWQKLKKNMRVNFFFKW